MRPKVEHRSSVARDQGWGERLTTKGTGGSDGNVLDLDNGGGYTPIHISKLYT